MTKPAEYPDQLRAAFLGLSVIPVAALQATNYWFQESLERTSTLAAAVITSVALARSAASARPRAGGSRRQPDLAPEVLARELLEAARGYVRAMVNLPHDSSTYFTGQLERQLEVLQLKPDVTTNFESYMRAELDRVFGEFDRLAVFARTEMTSRPRVRKIRDLVKEIDRLRTHAGKVRDEIKAKERRPDLEASTRVLALGEARLKLESAFRDAANLLPAGRRPPTTVKGMAERLEERTRAVLRRRRNGKEETQGRK
jgi:hypothetical protein